MVDDMPASTFEVVLPLNLSMAAVHEKQPRKSLRAAANGFRKRSVPQISFFTLRRCDESSRAIAGDEMGTVVLS
jgi:hypothetical protein